MNFGEAWCALPSPLLSKEFNIFTGKITWENVTRKQ
jgi:aryl-alcohol dehydrogenase-like predicted oxidoreductase